MTWIDTEVWRFTAAMIIGLLAVVLLKDHGKDASARASVFLAAGVAAHLVLPLLLRRQAPLGIVHPVLWLALSAPFAFWVAAHVHFEDGFRLRARHGLLLLILVGAGYGAWLAVIERRLPAALAEPGLPRFWLVIPRLLALGVVLHALFRTYTGARSDLVLSRLKARYGVLLLAGGYILAVLVGEVLFTGSSSEAIADRVHSGFALAMIFAAGVLSLRARPDFLRPARPVLDSPPLDPSLVETLRRLVEVDQVFREEGLTIGGLADRLGIQEYKARQLINSELGFRNFNAFLHHFRIREAQKVLADPAKAHLGVAQVAYEVGYQSLATFNRAFKELTGRTPSEVRAKGPAPAPQD